MSRHRRRTWVGIIPILVFFFFFNDTATTEIYTLSLHDALPISTTCSPPAARSRAPCRAGRACACATRPTARRSEEHTSELQSQSNLVCRLLLEKKKKTTRFCTSACGDASATSFKQDAQRRRQSS